MIRVQKLEDNIFESYFEIALDHMPSSIHEQKIRDLKVIEKEGLVYVLVMYYNGVIALIDINEQVKEEEIIDDASENSSKVISVAFVVVAFLYFSFVMNHFFRPRNAN